MTESRRSVLSVQELTKDFGLRRGGRAPLGGAGVPHRAVDSVSFEIGEGETTCIIDWRPDREPKTTGTSVNKSAAAERS